MIGQPLDELYLTWLYRQVGSVSTRQRSRTYWSLFRHLYNTEFVWFVPNDGNRLEEGRDLRFEFLHDDEIEISDPEWESLGCSMFELLLGLARKLAFETEGSTRAWFWQLLDNIKLAEITDDKYESHKEEIDDILETVIWRRYKANGHGGLFPLNHARQDQRKIELWYQLNAYLIELDAD